MGIHVQSSIAEDGAFSVAPDNCVANETADPYQKAEHILQRGHRKTGDGILNCADESPVDPIGTISNVSVRSPALVVGCA